MNNTTNETALMADALMLNTPPLVGNLTLPEPTETVEEVIKKPQYFIDNEWMNDSQVLNLSSARGINSTVVCYAPSQITTNGVWQNQNPLQYSLPLFILQLMIIVMTTRGIVYALKPFRQPRVVSEILGGIVLGPSCLGWLDVFSEYFFPLRSVMVLETMANIGLLYYLFLLGVEMDLSIIKRTGQQALVIAVAAIILPFLTGTCSAIIYSYKISATDTSSKRVDSKSQIVFVMFLGVSMTVTAFPVITRLLADLKLFNTELGRIAMSAAVINDMVAWVLLAIAIIIKETSGIAEEDSGQSPLGLLYGSAFIMFIVFVARPAIVWMVRRTPEGESFNDFYICLILTGVMICGFVTDAIGTHSVFGAFIFGLIIPNGPLGTALIEKLEDFVTALLLPLFYAVSGLRTSVKTLSSINNFLVFYVLCIGNLVKIGGTLLSALLYDMPFHEALSLGLLMNTKGLLEMIVLNIMRDKKAIDIPGFAMMVFFALVTTAATSPAILAIYKPGRRFIAYKRRTIQRARVDSELRLLVCVHTPRNVPTMINLLEASHATKKSPICIYALHLVELTGRASAMLIVHTAHKSGRPAASRTQAQSDHIMNAFDNYAQNTGNVTVQPLTAISPYSTMHEDICNLAEDKRVTLIIVPFHKQQTVDGGMEPTNPAFRNVNQNVLANAPCSVGLLIDRGLGGAARVAGGNISHQICLLFFGGPDDREALAYAWRMAEHPGVNLTVMRFIPGEGAEVPTEDKTSDNRTLKLMTDMDRQKQLDEDYISEFREKTGSNESVVFKEKMANNGEETVSAVRGIDVTYDLYIVGRGQGVISPLTAGLTDWSETPELGPMGDLLASADFAATISVLVLQQYAGDAMLGDGLGTPDSPGDHRHQSQYNDVSHSNTTHQRHKASRSFENEH